MRRVALVALLALAFAPVARAGCGTTTSALAGGQTVQHTFAAGSYRVALTSDAGTETVWPVVPRIPVTRNGRRFQHGALRVRLRGPASRRVEAAGAPRARFGGDHVEVDKTRQVLFVVRGGNVALAVPTSTGATGNTPVGTWHVYRKVVGFDWVLHYPSYFLRGFAVHGYPDVPAYPASHGCARMPMWIATTVYAAMPPGSTVYVYT